MQKFSYKQKYQPSCFCWLVIALYFKVVKIVITKAIIVIINMKEL